jgi:hypothetical protein
VAQMRAEKFYTGAERQQKEREKTN